MFIKKDSTPTCKRETKEYDQKLLLQRKKEKTKKDIREVKKKREKLQTSTLTAETRRASTAASFKFCTLLSAPSRYVASRLL